ncbi:MAG: c-type cytochrome [Planctomycetota bacterium]
MRKSWVQRRDDTFCDTSNGLSWIREWNVVFILLVFVACFRCDANANEAFVIGFERFARHGDMTTVDAGSLLFNELNCSACHLADATWHAPREAPNLSGVGIRLQSDWLRRYLVNPSSVDPGTTMPNVMQHLDPTERDEAIESIVAFLSTQQMPFATLKAGGALPVVHEFWNRGNPERGRDLYHTVGCVACHEPDSDYPVSDSAPSAIDSMIEQLDPEELAEMGLSGLARRVTSIPHGDLKEKFSRQSLTMFLLDPTRTRPCGRMPNMRLSPDEAADLTAHLIGDADASRRTIESFDTNLIERGRKWFEQLRCAQCHEAEDVASNRPSKPLTGLDPTAEANCIDHATGALPRFALDADQRNALHERLRNISTTPSATKPSPAKPSPANQVQQTLIQWNCVGCHARREVADQFAIGGVGRFRKGYFETVGSIDLGDEGRLPPPLTGVGRKLASTTLAAVFAAKTARYRPYMTIRMPAYHPKMVQPLIRQLATVDSVERREPTAVFGSARSYSKDDLYEAGRQLSDTGCVQCHLFAGESLPGVVGIDLQGINNRVQPEWFAEFVRNPGAVKNRTRMPTFFPDGKSNSPQILDGNVDAQIAALWLYLSEIKPSSLPNKIAESRSANYELTPIDRPIVLRTFMQDAGTHAIAVGFPRGIHYAWDSETCRLALAWKGSFMDARSTWFERFAPPTSPLGESIVRLPTGVHKQGSSIDESNNGKPKFRGYKLDAGGVPTLMYQIGIWKIEDRMEAVNGVSLRRSIRARPQDSETTSSAVDTGSLMWSAFTGKKLEPSGSMAFRDEQGVVVKIEGADLTVESRESESGQTEWWLRMDAPTDFSMEYSW